MPIAHRTPRLEPTDSSGTGTLVCFKNFPIWASGLPYLNTKRLHAVEYAIHGYVDPSWPILYTYPIPDTCYQP